MHDMYIDIPVYDNLKDVLHDNESFKTNNIFLSLIGSFRLTGEGFQTLTYTLHLWPLQWGFVRMPHLLREGTSVYNGQLRGPMIHAFCPALGRGAAPTWFSGIGLSWPGFETNAPLNEQPRRSKQIILLDYEHIND